LKEPLKHLALFIPVAASLLLGCHKNPSHADTAAQSQGTPGQPAKPLPPPPAYIATRADNYVRQGVAGEVDPTLTSLLRAFVQKNGRLPQSFAEFTSKALDNLPNPPQGKKWVIDAADVQVKAVPAK